MTAPAQPYRGEPTDESPAARQIAAAVTLLDDIDQLPLAQRVTRFETLHDELQGALTDLDRG